MHKNCSSKICIKICKGLTKKKLSFKKNQCNVLLRACSGEKIVKMQNASWIDSGFLFRAKRKCWMKSPRQSPLKLDFVHGFFFVERIEEMAISMVDMTDSFKTQCCEAFLSTVHMQDLSDAVYILFGFCKLLAFLWSLAAFHWCCAAYFRKRVIFETS